MDSADALVRFGDFVHPVDRYDRGLCPDRKRAVFKILVTRVHHQVIVPIVKQVTHSRRYESVDQPIVIKISGRDSPGPKSLRVGFVRHVVVEHRHIAATVYKPSAHLPEGSETANSVCLLR